MSGENETAATLADDGIIDLDAPEVETTEEVKEDEKAEEKPEGEGDEPKSEGDDEKPKKLSGAQRAKLREQRLLTDLANLQRENEALKTARPKEAGADEPKPPKEEDFNGDFFAYQAAKTAFEAVQAIREENRKDRDAREASEKTTREANEARERDLSHAERVEDAREHIADYDEVMGTMKGVNVRNDVIEEIKSSEKGALIAYHLAQNPDKLQAMNDMSPRELAREMGRLEATVRLPSAKKATTAPAPPRSPSGGSSPSNQDTELAAYIKKTYG